ncbi:MAG: isocitrate lyase/PEP mutase family protein [Hyphomicrobiales bacterium]|nr:isocitrate lyase/PEP mutase family protein [Hyphomicrobiales bacterium]
MTALSKSEFSTAARSGNTIWVAGCYDALSAKLAEEAGFPAIMTSGFAVSASYLGVPDVELYTMSENLTVVRNVANAVSIPMIADGDTGYGNAINVMRTVREFEQAGVAAIIFEDQEAPKRCPAVATHIDILPIDESAAKIEAAVQARRDPDTLIVARTDALTEDAAIQRAQAYVSAGADLIQPISRCFTSFDGLRRLREACDRPLSLQILGWLETDLSREQIEEVAGLAVYPLVTLMTATEAMRQNLAALMKDRSTAMLPQPVTSMGNFKKFIGFEEIEHLQSKFLVRRMGDVKYD